MATVNNVEVCASGEKKAFAAEVIRMAPQSGGIYQATLSEAEMHWVGGRGYGEVTDLFDVAARQAGMLPAPEMDVEWGPRGFTFHIDLRRAA